MDRYYDLNGLPSVSNDDYRGSYEMTKWLIGATGKKIALMMPDEKRTAMEMRSRGFIDASLEMERAQNNRIYRFTFSENNDENMRRCVDEMVAEGYKVIYDVTGDQNTIEVIRYLNRKGRGFRMISVLPDTMGLILEIISLRSLRRFSSQLPELGQRRSECWMNFSPVSSWSRRV